MEINYDICNVLDDKMMEYSAYVILHRALPSLEDGFKVSLRRILYTMHKENMNKLTKSANVSGQVMKIHPHSDCYPTIVNMVQTDNHTNPFIIGKGAFAYHTSRDTQPASSRYSEIRIAPYSQDMMEGLKKDSVDMIPTFDGSSTEPLYIPTKHCNLLTHSQQGLGVGMACNFPSFNLNEVCDYTIHTLLNKDVDDLIPDFATGGKIVFDKAQIQKVNSSGLGSIDIQSKYIVDGEYILIKEIPYTTTREQIIEKIIELVKCGKVKEILDVKDTTDIKGMEIEIKVKKNTNCDLLMSRLYKLTPLQSSFSANMNCLINGKPKVLGVKSIIDEWIKFRKQCINRELQYDISQLLAEQEKLNGLAIILADLDKAISLIRSSRTEKEAMDKLIAHFNLTQPMATYISSIRMVNMNNEWLTKQTDKLTKVNQELKDNQENLSNDSYYTNRIISELEYIKKTYGQPRKTEVIHEVDDVKEVNIVPEENCVVCITKEGYCKLTQRRSDTHKLKDGDSIILNENTTNKSTALLFTSLGNCYKVYLDELDYTLPSNLGTYLPSQLQFDKDEAITSAVVTRDYKGHLINVFEDNRLAKITLESFKTAQRRGVLKNSINTDSKLLYQTVIAKEVDLLVQSTLDKVLIVSTSDFNAKGSKNTAGDGLIKAKNNSVVKSAYPLTELNLDCIDVDYYKGKRNSVGCYLKKTDEIKENKQ